MALEQPLVSVVIPTFNHGHLIGRALRSVLSQTWSKLEVIVVDNHSSDGTERVVTAMDDPRIKYIQFHNRGIIAASRNVGIRAASGEWIAFLDSDDWWSLGKIESCAKSFDFADVIYHRLQIVPEARVWMRHRCIRSWQVHAPVARDLLLRGNPVATSALVVRKELMDRIRGFDERRDFFAAEDYDAWIRLAGVTEKFCFLAQTLGFYYLSQHSSSRRDMSLPLRAVMAVHSVGLTADERGIVDAYAAYAAGRHSWAQGDLPRAKTELIHSLQLGRQDIRIRSAVTLALLFGSQLWARLRACLGRPLER